MTLYYHPYLTINNMTINQQVEIAQILLNSTGLTILDAARLICELIEETPRQSSLSVLQHCRHAIRLAAKSMRLEEQTVTFSQAVDCSLDAKSHRRPRTIREIRSVTLSMLKDMPEFGNKPLRSITTEECQALLNARERTPRQFFKARTILYGVFSFGVKQGWCSHNPVTRIEQPHVREKEIKPLTPEEISRIKRMARKKENRPCRAAIGLMLYAGIRPYEVTRLTWKDINFEDRIISLRPRHTKTGGARHVHIPPVLERCLRQCRPLDDDEPICPPNWERRWRAFRLSAGFTHWQQDCLRHTYASYHAKYHRNFSLLQMEMGHRSADLLRTRYLNMDGITKQDAYLFWR